MLVYEILQRKSLVITYALVKLRARYYDKN